MPRLMGVDIPGKKHSRFALRYIHGIGPKRADDVLAACKIDPAKNAACADGHAYECVISTDDSKVKICVIPTDEESVIASDTLCIVTGKEIVD
mgnify:CR=1 FL=1